MTNTQIRKLGDRLRSGAPSESDLTLLEEFRDSFVAPYQEVIRVLTEDLRLQPTGRSRKWTDSIIAKLRRLKTRLDRMQDIAGCRVVVGTIAEQDSVVKQITESFAESEVDDLREHSHSGYRAVHVIVHIESKPVEIQIRTVLQDLWADFCERLAYAHGIELKYGGGPHNFQLLLQVSSDEVASVERGTSERTATDVEDALRNFIAPFRNRGAKHNGD
jgi:GTP pyrophosphokinase